MPSSKGKEVLRQRLSEREFLEHELIDWDFIVGAYKKHYRKIADKHNAKYFGTDQKLRSALGLQNL